MRWTFLSLIMFLLFSSAVLGKRDLSMFSGRILSTDFQTGFVKIRHNFSNGRFLNKGTRISVWGPDTAYNPKNSCSAIIVGKSPDYLLLRVKQILACKRIVNFSGGQAISLRSESLVENINTAKELRIILNKKRLALASRVKNLKDLIDGYPERVNSINTKYDTLIQKLNLEWKQAIQQAEEERVYNEQEYRNYVMRLDEIDFKMEKYHIEDNNLYTDRWSLDPSLYLKK